MFLGGLASLCVNPACDSCKERPLRVLCDPGADFISRPFIPSVFLVSFVIVPLLSSSSYSYS